MRREEMALGATPQQKKLKEVLERRMKELGIKAAELARRTELSKDAISSYVNMRSLPTKATLRILAKELKCTMAELMPEETVTDEIEKICEIRNYSQPGFNLIVARILVPADEASEVWKNLNQMHSSSLAEIAKSSRKKSV